MPTTDESVQSAAAQERFAARYSSQQVGQGLDRQWPFPIVRFRGKCTSELVWHLCSLLVVFLLVAGAIVTLIEYHETLEERTDRLRKELVQGCGDWSLHVTSQGIETSCSSKLP